MKLTFLPDHIEWTGSPGKTLMEIASEVGVRIDGNCGGEGTCGKCIVKIISFPLPDPCEEEYEFLSNDQICQGYRLSCFVKPRRDMKIETFVSKATVSNKVDASYLHEAMTLKGRISDPGIIKKVIVTDKPVLGDNKSHAGRILDLCGSGVTVFALSVIREIPSLLKEGNELTATIRGNEIIHLENNDVTNECYGVAFDIGTTTIGAFLWNLTTGELVGTTTKTNPQSAFGADVIARIQYADRRLENTPKMQRLVLDCMSSMLKYMTKVGGINRENIYSAIMVGNTTMTHLVLGVNPLDLANSPYLPVFNEMISGEAISLNLPMNKNARFLILPGIAGHIGSDITAGIFIAAMGASKEAELFIDIGTNGEIVMSANNRMVACSTAAGPAFEGASITYGIRAVPGAIEKIFIEENDLKIETIEDAAPIGICGSGIIDAVAALLKVEIIDISGRMSVGEEITKKGFSQNLARRIREGKSGREFVLAYREEVDDIVITQKDIREIQLAKGAIGAGIQIMMKELGINVEDIKKIMIAGVFGSNIGVESAIAIGLIPKVKEDRVVNIGNAAGTGASLVLLSQDKLGELQSIVRRIEHLEISTYPDFQDEYFKALEF